MLQIPSSSPFIFSKSFTFRCSLCVWLPHVLRCNLRWLGIAPQYRHNRHHKYNKHPNLISVYEDQNIHGFQRGVGACFAQPIESWLSVLSDAVPFIQDCLVVAPSTMSLQRLDALLRRAQVHFPQVHVAQLQRVSNSTTFAQSLTNKRSIAINSKTICLSTPTHSFTSPLQQIAQHSLDVVVFADNVFGTEMLFDSPWHISLAAKALRPHGVLALFGYYNTQIELTNPQWARQNVQDYLVTHEHEVQRIISSIQEAKHQGNIRRGEQRQSTQDNIFTANNNNIDNKNNNNLNRCITIDQCRKWQQKETVHIQLQTSQYQGKVNQWGKVQNECDINNNTNHSDYLNSKNQITHQQRCIDTDILMNVLERAWQEQRSINVAHADTYIPFLAVKRKQFISQYALSTSTLIAYLRSLPTYTLLHKWLKKTHHVNMGKVNFGQARCNGDDDFVNVNNSIPQNTKSNTFNDVMQSSAHKQSSRQVALLDFNGNNKYSDNRETRCIFVQRKVNKVDPLEALYYCLQHHLQASANQHLCGNQQHKHHNRITFSQREQLKSRRAYSAFAPLRGVIRHFTVVCSNRSINCIDSSNKFSQLPSSAKPQYRLE